MILYIETSFIIGAATGRDARADDLFRIADQRLRIALPSICVMEACSWFEGESKRRQDFNQQLDTLIHELRRDVTSPHARSLVTSLEQARIANQSLLNDVEGSIEIRLHRILHDLAGVKAQDETFIKSAELIHLELTRQTNLTAPVRNQPTDNLILSVIADHARKNPAVEKVLLSSNSKDFDTPAVRALLASAGINEFFSRTDAFLGWFQSRSHGDTTD